MVKGRYVDQSDKRKRSPKNQLVENQHGRLFLECKDKNSMPEGHRDPRYILIDGITLSFYCPARSGSKGPEVCDETWSYEFPAESMIYRLGRGRYEVVSPDRTQSIVLQSQDGVFERTTFYGFGSSGSVVKPRGYSSGKRHSAPGHL